MNTNLPEKKEFIVTVGIKDQKTGLTEVWIENEHDSAIRYTVLTFKDQDEWNSFTTQDGHMYDVHFLTEYSDVDETDYITIEIYSVIFSKSVDGENLIMCADTSEEGQQEVELRLVVRAK